jgi:hypothetical protein
MAPLALLVLEAAAAVWLAAVAVAAGVGLGVVVLPGAVLGRRRARLAVLSLVNSASPRPLVWLQRRWPARRRLLLCLPLAATRRLPLCPRARLLPVVTPSGRPSRGLAATI